MVPDWMITGTYMRTVDVDVQRLKRTLPADAYVVPQGPVWHSHKYDATSIAYVPTTFNTKSSPDGESCHGADQASRQSRAASQGTSRTSLTKTATGL